MHSDCRDGRPSLSRLTHFLLPPTSPMQASPAKKKGKKELEQPKGAKASMTDECIVRLRLPCSAFFPDPMHTLRSPCVFHPAPPTHPPTHPRTQTNQPTNQQSAYIFFTIAMRPEVKVRCIPTACLPLRLGFSLLRFLPFPSLNPPPPPSPHTTGRAGGGRQAHRGHARAGQPLERLGRQGEGALRQGQSQAVLLSVWWRWWCVVWDGGGMCICVCHWLILLFFTPRPHTRRAASGEGQEALRQGEGGLRGGGRRHHTQRGTCVLVV